MEESAAFMHSTENRGCTIKLEAVGSFETLVPIYKVSQHLILEDGNFCLVCISE